MTNSNNLRLYTEDDEAFDLPEVEKPVVCVSRLCEAFSAATGTELAWHESPTGALPDETDEVLTLPVSGARSMVGWFSLSTAFLAKDGESTDATAIQTLATDVSKLLEELHVTRAAPRSREAELATGVPFVVRPAEERAELAMRLEAVLRGGAEAVGCHAAALYLLDDATQFLKIRSHWGLDDARFAEPPRPLRGAKADLEALTGHAVVLERPDRFAYWSCPEQYRAAICVPVSTAAVPLGTLWVFAERPQQFSDNQVNLVEIVAGRLAVELEREILLRDALSLKPADDLFDAIAWQRNQWHVPPAIDGWEFTALGGPVHEPTGASLTWHFLEDGSLAFNVARAHESRVAAAQQAAALTAVFRSHQAIRRPVTRLSRAADVVSMLSAGEEMGSACCGTLHPDNGQLELAASVGAEVFLVRPHAWEKIDIPGTALGDEALGRFRKKCAVLHKDDVLLIICGRQRAAAQRVGLIDGAYMAEMLLRHFHLPAMKMQRLIEATLQNNESRWYQPPTVFLARRKTGHA